MEYGREHGEGDIWKRSMFLSDGYTDKYLKFVEIKGSPLKKY